jgi:hypothetical protein
LSDVVPDHVPESPGLVEIDEDSRHLYVVRISSLRPLARQLSTAEPFRIVAGLFWHPDPHRITLRYVEGARIAGVSILKWEHRLIHDLDPVLNWPIHKMAG